MSQTDCGKWPTGSAKMVERIRCRDWSAASLGPIEEWPQCLKCATEILLRLPLMAVLVWGEDDILLYNDACARFLELRELDLLGRPLTEAWPASYPCKYDMQRARREGISFISADQEFILHYHGRRTRKWFDLSYSAVPDAHGNPIGALAIFTDTSERIRAERALRDSEQYMGAIFTEAQVGLSVISRKGRFLRVNDEICRILDRPRAALLGTDIRAVTHPEDIANAQDAVARLLAIGETRTLDKRYVRPDGRIIFANSRISRLGLGHGNHYSILAVTVDLTERMLTQRALVESEARFRVLAEASPALIWQFDPQGAVVYTNASGSDLTGLTSAQFLGSGWKAIVHPADLGGFLQQLNQASRAMTAIRQHMRVKSREGQWHWHKVHAAPWFAADGQYAGHVGISIDVDDSVKAQEELRIGNERLKLAIESSGEGIWDWDTQTNEIACSKRTREILGISEDKPFDHYEQWEALLHPNDAPAALAGLRDCLDGKKPFLNIEYRVRIKERGWRWVLTRAIVVQRDAHNMPLRMTGTITDISDKRRAEDVIWRQANFDSLTGLPNRRLFRDRLDQEVIKSRRTGLPLALLFIDLDRFKETNDLLGHVVGDHVLVEAARRIRACVRQSDTVARLGGDEFIAILTALDDLAHVEPIADKINQALAAPLQIGSDVVHLFGSIGITLYPHDAANAENLIRNADQAMYVAKNDGRNQFSYFTPSMRREAQERWRLIGDLRKALARAQLKVYYQPVIDLATGNVVKAEALLRWEHPQLGLIEPERFITFAEEAGLMAEIGDWVLGQAAACSRRWNARLGRHFQVSINKSALQFLHRTKSVNWPEYLHGLGLPGGCIVVEISEGVLQNVSPAVAGTLVEYHNAGIQIAIDGFGTGYSSMAYLKKFSVDFLKIDRSFVADIVTNDSDQAIIRSVTAMAHELGLQVIAEGIETAEQRTLVAAAHCDFGQGYLFSKPIPVEDFDRMLGLAPQ